MTSIEPPEPEFAPGELLELFEKKRALLNGHFLLSSGLHSEKYLQCALVLQHPDAAGRIGKALARQLAVPEPTCVVGPAIGGIVIAQEVARALGVRSIFAEREAGVMVLRRGFAVEEGEGVIVVEDIITTGGSAQETVDMLTDLGAKVLGIGAIIDRSGGRAEFSVPFKSLERLEVKTYTEGECPLCLDGGTAYKPGSRNS
jgi:orotate phosphoribosyltransferase